MQIAKIVNSISHIEYTARILDRFEVKNPPDSTDYGLGHFVAIETDKKTIVAVISNSQLINPEYTNPGPRLSTPAETNRLFSPDYISDQGILVNLILLGWLEAGVAFQHTPEEIIQVYSIVRKLTTTELQQFHYDQNRLKLNYYSSLTLAASYMATPLLLSIIDRLEKFASSEDLSRLSLLRKNIEWQQAVGTIGQKR